MTSSLIIIPTYNEKENLAPLVREIRALPIDSGILIVDDNSPDGTGQIADGLAASDERVQVIHRPAKLGLGTAHIAGMRAALASDASHILTMDADYSHHPRYVPAMLEAATRFDVVIGSRYVRGGGTLSCTAPRRLLSHGANLCARTVLHLDARDTTAGFRAYRRAVLEAIPLDEIVSDGYSFLVEVLYLCQEGGWRIGEVPIVFENRQRGASKISRLEILRAAQTVARLAKARARRRLTVALRRKPH